MKNPLLAQSPYRIGSGWYRYRVNRGGSWFFNAWNSRVSFRFRNDASHRRNDRGFRLYRTLEKV